MITPRSQKGMTLIELMIVVAILAILAAIATIAYGRYVKSARVQKLKQYAMEIASGEERYRSRNNTYFSNPAQMPYVGNEDKYKNLLDFNHNVLPETKITTEAWIGGGTGCTICSGIGAPDPSLDGFAVKVTMDMDSKGPPDTTVMVTNNVADPVLTNEGQ